MKSFNKNRMKENMQIFDWELTDEEKDQILQKIPQMKSFKGEEFVSENEQYKFWKNSGMEKYEDILQLLIYYILNLDFFLSWMNLDFKFHT